MEPLYSPPGTLTAHQVATLLGITLGGVRLLVHRRQLARIGGSPGKPSTHSRTSRLLTASAAHAAQLDAQVSAV